MKNKKPEAKYSTVMLIDDNEIDNFINEKMISGCNFADHVYIHTSGKSALEFIKNFERIGNVSPAVIPEIIFLDINMPIMDGFQFIEEFEKLPDSVKSISKIIMLTTSINPKDMEAATANKRIIKYLNKPLSKGHLETLQA